MPDMKDITCASSLRGIFKLSFLLFLGVCNLQAQKIETVFQKIWQTPIGQTSFRTNIYFDGKDVLVASNGKARNIPNDRKDGLYILDASNGEVIRQFTTGAEGENGDATGVVVDGEKVFFGSDNGYLHCYKKDGSFLWVSYLRGTDEYMQEEILDDLEGVPAMADLNGDGTLDVVMNVEGYGVVAVDGSEQAKGKILWTFTYAYSEGSYMNSPAIFDVNKDGTADVIIGAKREEDPEVQWDYQNSAFAINGRTGKPLWQYQTGSNIHASPVVLRTKEKDHVLITATYSVVNFLATDGKLDRYMILNEPGGGISGLFGTPAVNSKGILLVGTSWWGDDDGVWVAPIQKEYFHQDEMGGSSLDPSKAKYTITGRVSASGVVADVIPTSKGMEFLVPTEGGELLIYSEQGDVLHRLLLPSGSECTPLVADIDGDKKLEVLIADYAGNITCYRISKKKRKVLVGGFRGGGQNLGVIDLR